MHVGIATARIHGVTDAPRYFAEKLFYCFNITFTDSSYMFFKNLCIYAGKTFKEACESDSWLKDNFSEAGISDGSQVSVIFDTKSGDVRAISSYGEDCWIDVADRFSVKTYSELKIKINSLKVF